MQQISSAVQPNSPSTRSPQPRRCAQPDILQTITKELDHPVRQPCKLRQHHASKRLSHAPTHSLQRFEPVHPTTSRQSHCISSPTSRRSRRSRHLCTAQAVGRTCDHLKTPNRPATTRFHMPPPSQTRPRHANAQTPPRTRCKPKRCHSANMTVKRLQLILTRCKKSQLCTFL